MLRLDHTIKVHINYVNPNTAGYRQLTRTEHTSHNFLFFTCAFPLPLVMMSMHAAQARGLGLIKSVSFLCSLHVFHCSQQLIG